MARGLSHEHPLDPKRLVILAIDFVISFSYKLFPRAAEKRPTDSHSA